MQRRSLKLVLIHVRVGVRRLSVCKNALSLLGKIRAELLPFPSSSFELVFSCIRELFAKAAPPGEDFVWQGQ
eukprot:4162774-Pleurochrysis_carterae.AAC.1